MVVFFRGPPFTCRSLNYISPLPGLHVDLAADFYHNQVLITAAYLVDLANH
jgi:hypothetical protein